MIQTKITIINKYGLHARAAAKLVKTSSAFSSSIMLGREGNHVDAKSIMSVMMLAASKGTELEIEISGSDEGGAFAAISQLIENNFDEGE